MSGTTSTKTTLGPFDWRAPLPIPDFSGVSAPYEPPASPELRIDASRTDFAASVELVVEELRRREVIGQAPGHDRP